MEMNLKNEIIIGRNSIKEALETDRIIDHILISKGEKQGSIKQIIYKCKERGIPIKEVSPAKLDSMAGGAVHQGIIAVTAVKEYSSVDDIFELAKERNEQPFIIIADGLNDPHNLGAVIRTAEASGAHGIIIPKRHSAGLSITVDKSSAGALSHMPVARVTNIAAEIDKLKERGLWIYGADMDGETWCKTDFSGSIGLVIGSEGEGIGPLIKKKCDIIVSLPMVGKIESLNVSVASGIIMYEILKQRQNLK